MLSDRGHEPYTVADVLQADARLIVRDFPNGTRQDVRRDLWRFAHDEAGAVSLSEPLGHAVRNTALGAWQAHFSKRFRDLGDGDPPLEVGAGQI